jgi:hypothetical protein
MMRSPMRRLLPALAVAAISAGAAGCNEFHYYDIDVSFVGFSASGADNGRIDISATQNMGLPVTIGTNLGIFEFATFADSGTLTFSADAYDENSSANPMCKTGTGSVQVPATATVTNSAKLNIMKTSDGCM